MVLEPVATKGILDNDHSQADEDSIGDAHQTVASQSVATEDKTADDGLQQIVGEAHPAKEAEMGKCATYALEGIPGRNHRRCNHDEDE